MPCHRITDSKGKTIGHICRPKLEWCKILWRSCLTCKRKSPMVSQFYAWYGIDDTCLRCGEIYQDNEQAERPFAPAWRKQNIQHAKEVYRREHPK